MDMDIDRFNLNISSPKIWASERTIVGALVELHVGADRHDGVRYRVGLVLVALRLVVVEALVVLLSRDDAQGQKKDQVGKCVPGSGRGAHVWPSAAISHGKAARARPVECQHLSSAVSLKESLHRINYLGDAHNTWEVV